MKKILIIKHGSLGDIIFALPAFASIRAKFNDSKIFLLTEKKYFSFFKKCPYVDSCIEDNRKNNYFLTFLRLLKLFNIKFSFIIDLQNSQRTSFYNLFFKIFKTTKICSSRSFAHYRYHIPPQGNERAIIGLFNQLSLIGVNMIKYENYDWLKIKLNENFNKPMALFIPGVSINGEYKQWQPNKFSQIAKYYEKLNYTICIVGTKEDKGSVSPILETCNKVINKIDSSPPEVIYSLALKSNIIFSNDTGPGHIASLAKNNFVWIVNDNNISRANQPIGKHIYKIQASSIKNISVKDVINFIEKNNLF